MAPAVQELAKGRCALVVALFSYLLEIGREWDANNIAQRSIGISKVFNCTINGFGKYYSSLIISKF